MLQTKLWVLLKQRHTVTQENRKQTEQSVDKIIKAIKDRIIRDIRNFFEEEEEIITKQWEKVIFGIKIRGNMKEWWQRENPITERLPWCYWSIFERHR